MTLAAVIFDMDGTLAETERDGHRLAFNAAFAEAGLDWQWDEDLYGSLLAVTGGKERMRRFASIHAPDFLQQPHADDLIQRIHREKTRIFVQALEHDGVPFRPGVRRLLEELREAGVRLAIATTTSSENVAALLRNNLGEDWAQWFEVIGAGDIVLAKKPAPDIYEWVLERLNLPASSCMAVEDSANGLRASMAAGIATLVTPSVYTQGDDFSGAAAVVPHMDASGTALAGPRPATSGVDREYLCGLLRRVNERAATPA